jgi:hypothetical protein
VNLSGVSDQDLEVVARMRHRVEQCRRLAAALTDKRASEILLQMAEEGEADIRRLETSHGDAEAPPAPMPKPQ